MTDIDMSSFEAQFDRLSPIMDNEMFEIVEYLRGRILDLKDVIDFRTGMMKEIDLNTSELEELEAIAREFLRKMAERRRPYEEEKSKLRRFVKEDREKLGDLERDWARRMAEIEALRKLREKRLEIDHSTADALWRIGVDGKKALPHQLEGAHRLSASGRAILGDKPGLGKTLQSIITVNMLRAQGKAKRVLIFTLKPVREDFLREIQKWYPGHFVMQLNQTLKGLKGEVLDVLANFPECILLTNYEVWRKDKSIIEKLIACRFDTVVLDEGHVFKNEKSVTFQNLRQLIFAENQCHKCDASIAPSNRARKEIERGRISASFYTCCPKCGTYADEWEDFRSVKHVFPMTGTPILNKPDDLWSMLHLIDPIAFPDQKSFLRDYCKQMCAYCRASTATFCTCDGNPTWRWVFKHGGSEVLLKSLGMKFTARDRDSAGVKMPPQEIRHHDMELDPELYPKQSEFISLLKEKGRLMLGKDRQVTMTAVIQWYTRMRQSIVWPDGIVFKEYDADGNVTAQIPVSIGESLIMDWAENLILEAIEDGDRLFVVSDFSTALREMDRRLKAKGIRFARLDGSAGEKARREMIDDFNLTRTKVGEHKFDVLLAQYDAGATGLNLHGAQQMILLDREWNPGKEQQAMDRLRRIGSEYSTIVHMPHVEGTGTVLIDALQEQKKSMLEDFDADVNLIEAMRKFLEG